MGQGASGQHRKVKAVLRANGGFVLGTVGVPMGPAPGTVLVRVRAAGINPVDYKMGTFLGKVVGLDFAGVVTAVHHTDTHGFVVGDCVFGGVKGALQEYIVTDPLKIARMPKRLSFVQAAALPVAYITGLQGLRDHGKLQAGGKVLVVGASGGCGTAAIQIARALNAGKVVGVCSGKNSALVKSLGAHEVVDYKTTRFVDVCERGEFDVVFDAASCSGGGENYRKDCLTVLRKGGMYVPLNGSALLWTQCMTGMQPRNTKLFLTAMARADLEEVARMIDSGAGALDPIIACVLPFTSAAVDQGFQKLKGRRTVGKIVFDVFQGHCTSATKAVTAAVTSPESSTSAVDGNATVAACSK